MATKDQLIASAQKNLEKGQIKKAIKDYQELLKLEPKVDQHKQKLADLLSRANFKEDALSLYDSLAKGYAERGFYAKAIAVYKQMQRIDPANPSLYLRLAELNRNLGLTGNAMSEFRALLDLYEKRNMAAESAGILQKMVELEPENINLQLRVLQNFLKDKLYLKAIETVQKACEVCAKTGDRAKSHKILQAILSHLPAHNELKIELAGKLRDAGIIDDAIFVLQTLLNSSPQDPVLLGDLAGLYEKNGDAENERLLLEQLQALESSDAVSERLLALSAADAAPVRNERLDAPEDLLGHAGLSPLLQLHQEQVAPLSFTPQTAAAESLHPLDEEELISAPENLLRAERDDQVSSDADGCELDDLLSLLPATALQPQSEEIVPEETLEVSIELPLEELVFDDIDSFVEELGDPPLAIQAAEVADERDDTFASPAESAPSAGIGEDDAIQLINIEYDFSEFDGLGLEIEPPAAASGQQIATASFLEPEQSPAPFFLDAAMSEDESVPAFSGIQVETALPLPALDLEFMDVADVELEEITSDDLEELEIELIEELSEEEEILELEPLDEEEDLSAELAALEELLDSELEEVSVGSRLDLNPAVDQAADSLPDGSGDFFDLAAEILDDGALEVTAGLANVGEIDRFRFDSVFSAFKKGVDSQIDHEDSEAHYDLGIAYKEMGLMDDAIDEFKKSMLNPKRLADSLILIGICHAEKGRFSEAEAIFLAAISRPEVQQTDKTGTQYELGLVYEIWDRPADALRTFEAVAQTDPCFRNVGEKIEKLRLLVTDGGESSALEAPWSAVSGKNRVSFV